MANTALSEMDLIHIAPLILQGLYTALLTKREDVIYTSSKQSPLSRGSPSCVLPTPTPPASTFYRWTCSSTPSPDDADEVRKGHYFCYPSMTSLTSSSATNRCSHPTTSSSAGSSSRSSSRRPCSSSSTSTLDSTTRLNRSALHSAVLGGGVVKNRARFDATTPHRAPSRRPSALLPTRSSSSMRPKRALSRTVALSQDSTNYPPPLRRRARVRPPHQLHRHAHPGHADPARHPRSDPRRLRARPRVLLRGPHRPDAPNQWVVLKHVPALGPYDTADPRALPLDPTSTPQPSSPRAGTSTAVFVC